MKKKFVEKMESGFVLADRIIPYTLVLICVYVIFIAGLVFLLGCKTQVNTCIKDKRYFAPQAKESHSERNAQFRKHVVNKTNRK